MHNFDSVSNCPETWLMAELAAIIILDLNISFLLTICSYRLLPAQRLLSSEAALSEMHDIISQLWLSNLDYCANKKRPASRGVSSMWKMWLEVRIPCVMRCVLAGSPVQSGLECSCNFHWVCCHWVSGGRKYTFPLYWSAACAPHHPRSVVQVLPVSALSPSIGPATAPSVFGSGLHSQPPSPSGSCEAESVLSTRIQRQPVGFREVCQNGR